MRGGVRGGGTGMDAPRIRTSVGAPRGGRSLEPQKKKLGDKPRNIENYAYWRDFHMAAGDSIRLPACHRLLGLVA